MTGFAALVALSRRGTDTAHSRHSPGYSGPSVTRSVAEAGLLVEAGGETLLFDCGRGGFRWTACSRPVASRGEEFLRDGLAARDPDDSLTSQAHEDRALKPDLAH
jgi:hypothetical protein